MPEGNIESLLSALEPNLGSGAILTDAVDTAKYLTDWPGKNTGRAAAVLRPSSTAEVSTILARANAAKTPVIPLGGNTGLAGGGMPDNSGDTIMLSLERMKTVRNLIPAAMTMTVEAGCILSELHDLVEPQGLFFPLNLGAKGSCTIGGNLATNAGGVNVVRYGNTRELCLGLEVVLPDGRIMDELSGLRKNNTGYDLRNLFIGAEGTLGVITAATLKLFHLPKARATAFAAVPDIASALDLLNRIQAETGGAVEAFEMMPDVMMHLLAQHLPELKQPFAEAPPLSVLIEIAATSDAEAETGEDGSIPVVSKLEALLGEGFESGMVEDAVLATSEAQRGEMWKLRESTLEAVTNAGPRIGFDISLPLDQVHEFVARTRSTVEAIIPGFKMCAMGHLGDGNLHYSLFPPEGSETKFIEQTRSIKTAVLDNVSEYRGSFSAEHGIGTQKLSEMARYKDPVALAVMRQVKAALDPNNIMNPGKVIPE
ncbi:MAG: FAD-binding oxidoreductase [Proteobacteria bacterium]|nr:FAD-binding oxidoreductase [Pseudomonadota bacterium]